MTKQQQELVDQLFWEVVHSVRRFDVAQSELIHIDYDNDRNHYLDTLNRRNLNHKIIEKVICRGLVDESTEA